MAAPLSALTLVTYLNGWDAVTQRLSIDLLIVPVGDPRQPATTGWPGVPAGPAFEGAGLEVVAHLAADSTLLPTAVDIAPSSMTFKLPAPAEQAAIFAALATQYKLTAPPTAPARSGAANLRKYLPTSYRRAFGFTAPSTELAVVDDSYHCARRCPPAANASDTPWSDEISWGDVFAMLLRQPAVARAAGLIHRIELDVGAQYAAGGWLFFSLTAGSAFQAQAVADAAFVRLFGARVPALKDARPLFTPVLFPIAPDAVAAAAFGPLDEVFPEAAEFDDGFAKIVHASQARSADHAEDGADSFQPPLKDMGIRLGWDDESMVVRLDRGLSETRPDGSTLPLAPSGAAGYRVDVRPAGSSGWSSLTRIRASGLAIGAARIPGFETELMVEVHPSQIGTQFWVPPHYAFWRGGSLVADTDDQREIGGEDTSRPSLYEPIDHQAAPLRYGQDYEFRVRMVDAVGGGPALTDVPFNPAEAPTARLRFRRHVPLGALTVSANAATAPSSFKLHRPGVGHPQAGFAGAPNALQRLADQARANRLAGTVAPLAVPDPDAEFVELRVMVLMPRFDPSGQTAGYSELYRTTRAFAGLDANGDAPTPLGLDLSWVDCARLSDVAWSSGSAALGSESGPLVLPTARQLRIEARALAREDASYFGDERARYGQMALLTAEPLYRPATAEPALFAPMLPLQALASVYLQPDPVVSNPSQAAVVQASASPVLVSRLAQAVDLIDDDGVLMPSPGHRMVFGCRGLKHVAAPDFSSIQLTAAAEMPNRWINVLRLQIDRDWSWLGYADDPFRITRTVTLADNGATHTSDLGVLGVQHTVSLQARRGTVERDRFELCLIDALEPPLGSDGLPYELGVTYEVIATLRTGAAQTFKVTNRLPITQPPRQVPKIVATGHAFSDYRILGDYEETGVRERVLWIEFAEPPTDPRDAFFARVLHQTADPMLLPAAEPLADPPSYDKRPVDPEWVRVVRPGQARDSAGLSVMQKLVPCEVVAGEKPRQFLLRPPPALTAGSPELFGMFTYEFAVGHDRGSAASPLWVTAQGRFGTATVLAGVQHPAPPLPIDVARDRSINALQVSSEFARAVKDGRVLSASPPNTEIWVVAYARVLQADGASWRNVQIGRRRAAPRRTTTKMRHQPVAVLAQATWTDAEIRTSLSAWGLSEKTPMGFVAIELIPEPNGRFGDPLGGDLGQVRVLRSSRLVSAGADCCP